MSDFGNDKMRVEFLALQAAAQEKIAAGASPGFAKIVAHVSACLRVLDGL